MESELASDPYTVLGVKRNASQEDIQKAYRQLAKKLHPDLNPGNKKAEDQFKDISAAYDLLGDAAKRARFDRGEIDASGQERPAQHFYRDFAGGAGHAYSSDAGFADFADAEDIISEIFGRQGRQAGANVRMRGADVRYHLTLNFLDAINGGKQQLQLPDGSSLEVKIPPGIQNGQVLRLRGKGQPGLNGGPQGDALIEIEVQPHPIFTRKDDDIHIELPIPLADAVLGGKISVPTPTGPVTMKVPKWSNTGTVLRLKGKGVPRGDNTRGDEYVALKVMLPDKPDPELEQLIAQWRTKATHQQASAEA
jgi:DnaJ-class molecular chaperone